MYKTADNLEDLDFTEELNAYDSILHAVDRSAFWAVEEQYKDADYFIVMKDKTEEDEIKALLNSCGFTAYLEYSDSECVRVG